MRIRLHIKQHHSNDEEDQYDDFKSEPKESGREIDRETECPVSNATAHCALDLTRDHAP